MHLFEVVGLLFVRSSDDTAPAPQLSAQIFVPFLNLIFTLPSPAHADESGHLKQGGVSARSCHHVLRLAL